MATNDATALGYGDSLGRRTTKSVCVSAALALGALLALANPAASGDPTVADVGRGVYEQYCSECHGVAGKGDGPKAASLQRAPADLTKIAERNGGVFPETKIAEIIDGRDPFPGHDTPDMPVWGERFSSIAASHTEEEASIRAEEMLLVAYLRSIQQK
jgi:mono/diheme cytochrome c family protein